MEEPAAGGLPQWTGVYAAFDDVALAARWLDRKSVV
mgnify:CR=1 FL=1